MKLQAIRAIVTYEICLALKLSPTEEQTIAYMQHSPDWEKLKKNCSSRGNHCADKIVSGLNFLLPEKGLSPTIRLVFYRLDI